MIPVDAGTGMCFCVTDNVEGSSSRSPHSTDAADAGRRRDAANMLDDDALVPETELLWVVDEVVNAGGRLDAAGDGPEEAFDDD